LRFAALMEPPSLRIVDEASHSPSPVPAAPFVVKNGSNR
jgi:hypothetical protein